MSNQLNAGATSETALIFKENRPIDHSLTYGIHSSKVDMIKMIIMAKWYSGNHGGLKLPDICLAGEEKPRKKLIQETCPNRGLNPGPLRDRRACYRLPHSSGLIFSLSIFIIYMNSIHEIFNINKFHCHKMYIDWGFMMLLTYQVISVAFYSEREKSDEFCSEALILLYLLCVINL